MTADLRLGLHVGDCIDVLRTLPANSVDACVADPPYNLSDSGKRDGDCLRRVIAEGALPQFNDGDTNGRKRLDLARPPVGGPALGREDRTVRVDGGVGVPERPLNLKGSTVREQEVDARNEAPALATDGDLSAVSDAEIVQHFGDFVLDSADGGDAAFCDGTCRCFTEPSAGVIAVLVALPRSAAGNLAGDLLGAPRTSHADIGLDDFAGRQPEGAAGVVTGPRAVRRAVLRLDLRGRTGELRAASATHNGDPVFVLAPAQDVGAGAGARGLPAMTESARVRVVDDGADGTFALHMPWHNLKSSRMTRGFMGKSWDGWESPASFQRWCREWAAEVFRVLKPGAHLIAFGGTRTVHRLACAIEDAGFEIRDTIGWQQYQGFPKSLDVSKAIDARPGSAAHAEWRAALRTAREEAGLSAADLAERVVGSRSGAVWNWEHHQFPEARHWPALKAALPALDDAWADMLAEAERAVIGSVAATSLAVAPGQGVPRNGVTLDQTTPATPDAVRWSGWGTALKPAHEPAILARKPLDGTVAANVLKWGTGALNLDACRYAKGDSAWPGPDDDPGDPQSNPAARVDVVGADLGISSGSADAFRQAQRESIARTRLLGHFPANIYACPKASRSEREAGCEGLPARTGAEAVEREEGSDGLKSPRAGAGRTAAEVRNVHPTVKPIALMRWLVRLVTPPGGVVLDPFLGSGTTACAAILEGFRWIGVEREADYARIAEARIAWAEREREIATAQGDLFATPCLPGMEPDRWRETGVEQASLLPGGWTR